MSYRSPLLCSTTTAGLLLACCNYATAAGPEKIRFNEHIRPILSNTCFQCHGPDEKKRSADLRLDTAEGATRDLGGYAAIVPGKPEKSTLLDRILSHDKDEVMPPPKSKKPPLATEDVALLRRWISEGAPYEGHWAFQPLSKDAPPQIKNTAWVRNAVDRFILHKLEANGIAPSEEAPKAVLLRRVSLDLTGIPPTPKETADFLADSKPDAYERAVDRLLASPHYGERWGRHWLDQARYADSNGYSVDAPRDMWPYRDWVIRALNEDMPFDRFTIEQLAGDLLPSPTKSQLIASAFHRNTMINQEGGSNAEQFRNEAVVDRVNTTGAVWMGLTVGCAQCHTHKYDPLSHEEYFKLFAFFNSSTDVNSNGETVEVLPGEILGKLKSGVTPARYKALADKVAKLKREAPGRQKAWFAQLQHNAPGADWQPVHVDTLTSNHGRDYALEENGYVRLSAGAKPKETLNLQCSATLDTVDAFRVRLAPDALKGKPATAVLSEFEVFLDGAPVPLAMAVTSKETPKNPAKALIDGDASTAWISDATSATQGEYEVWILPVQPLTLSGKTLNFRLRQETGAPFLGKFQIAVSANAPLLPPDKALADSAAKAAARPPAEKKLAGPENTSLTKAFAALDRVQAAADLELEHLRKTAAPASLLVMKDLAQPRPTFLHQRGDYLSPDEKLGALQPDTPKVLPLLETNSAQRTRLDLAQWLVRADNPLTPRVTVNRVWMHYFGLGLVETENDFGTQGSAPTHAALLDWLATNFIQQGWSFKNLHRTIVTSATYRQSSHNRPDLAERDPRNLWLARQNRVRLDAEVVRDSALHASGLLDTSLGGPPVFPPQPEGVYSFTQSSKNWNVSKGGDRYRRAIYTMFYRSAQHPLTSTFDAPNFSATCTRRLRSNTPLQALMLANDEAFYEMAQAAAARLWTEFPTQGPAADRDRITRAFEHFLARTPAPAELDKSVSLLARARSEANGSPEPAAEKTPTPAFLIKGQPAQETSAWTAFTRGLMNTDEFITRE
jgi:hypothetical protein